MSELPSLSFDRVVRVLQRAGFVVVRQRGSHIRLQKRTADGVLKITVPAHRPIKRVSILVDAEIARQAKQRAGEELIGAGAPPDQLSSPDGIFVDISA